MRKWKILIGRASAALLSAALVTVSLPVASFADDDVPSDYQEASSEMSIEEEAAIDGGADGQSQVLEEEFLSSEAGKEAAEPEGPLEIEEDLPAPEGPLEIDEELPGGASPELIEEESSNAEAVETGAMEAAVTSALNLVDKVTNDKSGQGYYWNNEDKILTLDNGFSLSLSNPGESALKLKAGTTIVLKGSASIQTNQWGIEALGDLTITSQEGTNGVLSIRLTGNGTNGKQYCGIQMENPEGKENRSFSITGNTIVDISGGDKCLYCSYADVNKNNLSVTDRSALRMTNDRGVASNFRLYNPQRIIWMEGSSNPVLLAEQEKKTLSSQTSLKLMSIEFEGVANNNTYTLTYDGEEHPVRVNTAVQLLSSIGIGNIDIVPINFSYDESVFGEYAGDNADFRDKELVRTTTQYEPFTAATGAPLFAASYSIRYSGSVLATMNIEKRKVKVAGLSALDKTYDGWTDAAIDYSGMTVACVNDYNGGSLDSTGIVASDAGNVGGTILPWAKAFFVEKSGSNAFDFQGGDGQGYAKSSDVAYAGSGTSAQKRVTSKKVWISAITLGDPNYEVLAPSPETANASQFMSEATIYPRSLSSSTVTATLDPDLVKWRKSGYKEADFVKSVTDVSPATPNHPELKKVLKADVDYLVNPNTNTIMDVSDYEITLTGQGNYTGTAKLPWTIARAQRKIEIRNPKPLVYNGQAAAATSGKNSSDFYFTVIDTDNDEDLTDELEDGSNLRIVYSGKQADGATYHESLEAPVHAGSYKVTITVDQTTRYTDAQASFDFKVLPKTAAFDWTCEGGSVEASEVNPAELSYNGTANVFSAAVNNVVEGDEVNVSGVVYSGTTTGGVNYNRSGSAPREAGSFSAIAIGLDNPDYTLDGSLPHNYTVERAGAWLSWEGTGSFDYDTKDHTPSATVHGLFSNASDEEDSCSVTKWTFSGKDVFGNGYTQSGGAVNAGAGTIRITATELDNPNYRLSDEEGSLSAEFEILPRDLSLLAVGTADDHQEIWADRLEYTGEVREPVIKWHKTGEDGASFGATLKKGVDYTASSSTMSLEHNDNGLRITVTGKGNYTGKTVVPWNIDKLASSIVVTEMSHYVKGNDGVRAADYASEGYDSPEFTYQIHNEDIEKNHEVTAESFVSIRFVGTTRNGTAYDDAKAPTMVGEYEAVLTLAETDHYQSSVARVPFVIKPGTITISSGVKAVDKIYDGKKDAVLDFSGAVLEGIHDRDKAAVRQALSSMTDPENGSFGYEASFESKHVALDPMNSQKIAAQTVSCGKFSILYTEDTPDVLCNYKVAGTGNQASASAKILPREVSFSGIQAKDKVYDGNASAELDVSAAEASGIVEGDKLKVFATGAFEKTGQEPAAKDVFARTGVPQPKKVSITYEGIQAANSNTDKSDYVLKADKSQAQAEAVISQAGISVKNLRAKDKIFDNTASAELDWSGASLSGILGGDDVSFNRENLPSAASYRDGAVAVSTDGSPTDKTGSLQDFEGILAGTCSDDYVISSISFKGRILPKPLGAVTWEFDAENLEQVPAASFGEGSGFIEGYESECEPVVRFYEEKDSAFAKALKVSDLKDNGRYVARVDGTTDPCYGADLEDPTIKYAFMYDAKKDFPNLEITSYPKQQDGSSFSITYGEELPEPAFTAGGGNLTEEDLERLAAHVSWRFTGTMRNGKKYDGETAPTAAGTYSVTATLEETTRYTAAEAGVAFVIRPAQVRILEGIKVRDKAYNGTNKAVLDFSGAVFDGILKQDEEEVLGLIGQDSKDYIRYTAEYDDKDVAYEERQGDEEGATEKVVADKPVTASGLSFIITEEASEILANYSIVNGGDALALSGKILPRTVTVTGIKVKDKVYDGKSTAALDLSEVKVNGKVRGESLGITASGAFQVTGGEKYASDVYASKTGKPLDKKVAVAVRELKAANDATDAGNYVLSEDSLQQEAKAKITPAELTSVVWSFDKVAKLPVASLSRAGGIVLNRDNDPNDLTVSFYARSDKAYKTPIKPSGIKKDKSYVARVDGFANSNYWISENLNSRTYAFTGGKIAEGWARQMNQGLAIDWKNGRLTVKWGKSGGAFGYYVYTGEVGKAYDRTAVAKDVRSKVYVKKNRKAAYKFYVCAYRTLNGRKVIIGKSRELTCAADRIDGYNPVLLNVSKTSVTLSVKKNKTERIQTGVYVEKKGEPVRKDDAKLYFWSTNSTVAAVSTTGNIVAKKPGTCRIYIMTQNGLKKTVSVKVK